MGKRSNGEGTIFRRKDGRWCGAYYDEEYKRHFVYGKTQAEVKARLKSIQQEKKMKADADARGYTLIAWIYEFLEKYKRNELKPSTYSSYKIVCRRRIEPYSIAKIHLQELSTGMLQEFYNTLVKLLA